MAPSSFPSLASTILTISLREFSNQQLVFAKNSFIRDLLVRKGIWLDNRPDKAQLGDPLFDRRILIQSHPPRLAARLLAAERLRLGLLQLYPQATDFYIRVEDGEILYREEEVVKDAEYLVALTDFLIDLTEEIEAEQRYRLGRRS